MEQCHQVFYGCGAQDELSLGGFLIDIVEDLLAVQCAVHVPMPTLL